MLTVSRSRPAVPGISVSGFPARRAWPAFLVLMLLVTLDAFALATGPYFPLQIGYQWEYQVNGFATRTRTITSTQLVNGALTFVEFESPTLDPIYLTNDSQGIRLHGNFDTESGGAITLSPPVVYAPADVNPAAPPLITQSGTATLTAAGQSFPLSYSSSSQFLPMASVPELPAIYARQR